ncbi:MAG: MurR/RpiR family transcriptional regulator [Pikeienuella sp.]
MQIRELLTGGGFAFTPSEERIVQALLNDYPGAGLGPAAGLAKRAGVSDPTVNRLVVKLGFAGFADFQARLLGEIEERLRSPLAMMGAAMQGGDDSPAQAYFDSAVAALMAGRTATPQSSYDRAVRLIMGARRVLLLGGRFSRFIAGILAAHLDQFRPGIEHIDALSAADFDRLVDLGRKDVVIAFDYRRYQRDVIAFVTQAAEAGAEVIICTDRWKSPAAKAAGVVLVSPVEARSPYDTMTPALAQTEALVAQIVAGRGSRLRDRISRIEEIRRRNATTEDGAATGWGA